MENANENPNQGPVDAGLPQRDSEIGNMFEDATAKKTDETAGEASPFEEVNAALSHRYELRNKLGEGGMGTVYDAYDLKLKRQVAIKILPAGDKAGPELVERFEREATTLAALDHPNIVRVYDCGHTPGGVPYIVMEFVQGLDLQRLRSEGRLDLLSTLDLTSQSCSALHYAHENGIIHRDIKPANIIVDKDGRVKVELGVGKGRTKGDKRQAISERDAKRDIERELGRRNKYST